MKFCKSLSVGSILSVFLPAMGQNNSRLNEEMIEVDGCRIICLLILVISLSNPLPVLADARNTETPIVLEGGRIITAKEAQQLQQGNKSFFADCRSAFNYGKGHIPTAKLVNYMHDYKKSVSDTDVSLKKLDAIKLPEEKNVIIVFYSHGSTGWKSYKAAKAAIQAGYSHVLWFRGGLNEWTEAGYPIEY